MTHLYVLTVYEIGNYRNPIYREKIEVTPLKAEQRLSALWNDYTPADGSRYRATMRQAGYKRVLQSIGRR